MGYKQFCKEPEKIENYEKAKKDDFVGWHCHHRLETHTPDGKRRDVDIPQKELIALGMYYNRPASELIFLPESEHRALKKGENNPFYGKKHSEESKKRIGEKSKGRVKGMHWFNNGKINIRAKECPPGFVPGRMGEAMKGNTYTKGMHWFNNGKINKVCFECPPGFVPGMLK